MSAILKSETHDANGKFAPGHKKLGGRPKGTGNRVKARLEALGVDCVEEILKLVDELKPFEQVKVYLELLSYSEPKLKPLEQVQEDPGANVRVSPVLILPAREPAPISQPGASQGQSDVQQSPVVQA